MSLLTSQKNQLFEIVEAIGFSPTQFQFEPVPSRFEVVTTALRLTYTQNPEYAFLFERRGRKDYHYVMYCPGLHDYEDEANPGKDWHLVKAYFREWLENLKREIGEVDKFKTLAITLSNSRIGFDSDAEVDSPFSIKEYGLLVERLEEASEALEDTDLDEDEIEVIRIRFEHLKDMGKRLNKSDWEHLFVGTMMSTMTQTGMPPEKSQSVWQLLKKMFGNLLLE